VLRVLITVIACRAGEWPRVLEVFNRLIRECEDGSGRLRPNVITFNTLIGAAGNAKEWEHALSFMEEMHEWGLSPDKVRASNNGINH
jgi:pentatricopeptide repeat protein